MKLQGQVLFQKQTTGWEDQQWLQFIKHSHGDTGLASSHKLSAKHCHLQEDAAYILALGPGLSEAQ